MRVRGFARPLQGPRLWPAGGVGGLLIPHTRRRMVGGDEQLRRLIAHGKAADPPVKTSRPLLA